ncbi:MAG: hypothetical protein ABSB35_00350 [Bryobacteraceae bacterium]
MPCDEWCRLLERYRSAVNRYNEAANNLGLVPGREFNAAWQRAEQARKGAENCRADLLHHEHEHACLVGAGQPEVHYGIYDVDTEEFILGDQGQSGG